MELWFYDKVSPGCRRMITEYVYSEDTYENLNLDSQDELTFQMDLQDWDTGITLHQADVALSPADF